MNKTLFAFLLALASLVLVCSPATAERQKVIGIAAPLTGPISYVGETMQGLIAMVEEKYDPQDKFRFVFEDHALQSPKALSAVRKLISADKADAIICFGSNTTEAIKEVVEQQKIPTMSIALSSSVTRNKRYVFRSFISVENVAKDLAAEVKRRKLKSIAIVTTVQEGMLAMRDAFSRLRPAEVVFDEEVAPGDMDLKALATRIKQLRPDGVFLALLAPQPSALSRQLRDVGYNGELFSGPQVGVEHERLAAQGALNGTWFSSFDMSNAQQVAEEFRMRFGKEIMPDGAPVYDLARILMKALGTKDPRDVIASTRNFQGILGTYTINNRNSFILPTELKVITADGFLPLATAKKQ